MNDRAAKTAAKRLLRVANELQRSARELLPPDEPVPRRATPTFDDDERQIHVALAAVSQKLADSYSQIKVDLAASDRISYAGTAHEIRELVATLLRAKAPEAEVIKKSWFKQEPNTSGPTQRQSVRFILEGYGSGSKELEVAQEVSKLDGLIADAIRAIYSRASDAAHRHKDRKEVMRLIKYFDTFVEDLLDLS